MKLRRTTRLSRHTQYARQAFLLLSGIFVLVGCQVCITGECVEDCGPASRVCEKPTMLSLARDLDELKHHIERYGSATPKVADIWSQSRLAKHREEYEKMMAQELTSFRETLQGSQTASDQAYFASAFALSQAIGGGQVATSSIPERTRLTDTTSTTATEERVRVAVPTQDLPKLVGSPAQGATPAQSSDIGDPKFFENKSFDFTRYKTTSGSGAATNLAISLEPSVYLEQKSRFLNYLNQFRRINEGDDTADSAGYALNLVRIPISVLPGIKTRKGYGAEVTLTMEPILGDDLLPITFRNLVKNDLLDQLSLLVTRVLNDRTFVLASITPSIAAQLSNYAIEAEEVRLRNENKYDQVLKASTNLPAYDTEIGILENDKMLIQDDSSAHLMYSYWGQSYKRLALNNSAIQNIETRLAEVKSKKVDAINALETISKASETAIKESDEVRKAIASITNLGGAAGYSERPSAEPMPYSQIIDNYGLRNTISIIISTDKALERDHSNKSFRHLPDVRSYLKDEIESAFRMLFDPKCVQLWEYCDQRLATAIRTQDNNYLMNQRFKFRQCVRHLHSSKAIQSSEYSVTACLAWTILVQSALLNEKLNSDIKETFTSKGFSKQLEYRDYANPRPPLDTCHAFNEYVKLRWPIRVFALDPVTQDQNIGDAFSRRREAQLALSMAFASGNISARNMSRYARRIEAEFNTIALNRTQVGFSHGENIFGWRFMPRFQTPDVESNLTVLSRDLFWGGPSKADDIRERCLEPGQRECVAIVLMPSFVPYAQIESVTDWFPLTDPPLGTLGKAVEPAISKDHELARAMHMSRQVKSIKNCAFNVQDANCFREVEHQVLLKRIDQLEARLPTQSYKVQIPYENTLGGFKVFNNGITDLAPVLRSWYGAPGINLSKETTIFLMGDHFSVHQTRVIAGGLEVNNPVTKPSTVEMLSRQVLKVTIPAGANTVLNQVGDGKPSLFVDVHLATPYGVTQHLLIPAFQADRPLVTGINLLPKQQLLAKVKFKLEGTEEIGAFSLNPENTELLVVDTNLPTALSPEALVLTFKLQVTAPLNTAVPVTLQFAPTVKFDQQSRTVKIANAELIKKIDEALKAAKVTSAKLGTQCQFELSATFTSPATGQAVAVDNKLVFNVEVIKP
jgi:hypothetical protein